MDLPRSVARCRNRAGAARRRARHLKAHGRIASRHGFRRVVAFEGRREVGVARSGQDVGAAHALARGESIDGKGLDAVLTYIPSRGSSETLIPHGVKAAVRRVLLAAQAGTVGP